MPYEKPMIFVEHKFGAWKIYVFWRSSTYNSCVDEFFTPKHSITADKIYVYMLGIYVYQVCGYKYIYGKF